MWSEEAKVTIAFMAEELQAHRQVPNGNTCTVMRATTTYLAKMTHVPHTSSVEKVTTTSTVVIGILVL